MLPVIHLNIKKVIGRTRNDDKNPPEIWVPLKYISNFWRTLEMPYINYEINYILTWSEDCVLISSGIWDQVQKCPITYTKLYVPVVSISTHR